MSFTLSFSRVPPGYTGNDTAHIEQDGVISRIFTDSDGNAGNFTATPDASLGLALRLDRELLAQCHSP